MREIKVKHLTFNIGPLSFEAVRELGREGRGLPDLTERNAVAVVLGHIEKALTEKQLQELGPLDYPDAKALFEAIVAETYGSRDEEKNLSASGSGSQTLDA